MPVPVVHEPDEGAPHIQENCCFCFQPTNWWTDMRSRKEGEQVACCDTCAPKHKVKDVPPKPYWCDMVMRFRDVEGKAYNRGHAAGIKVGRLGRGGRRAS